MGGPAPGVYGEEGGELVVYAEDGAEAGHASWQEGESFSLPLDPGTYRLVASSGDAHCSDQTVAVVADQFASVEIRCDVI